MPSVLVALEESLSSLSQWRTAVDGHQHATDETTAHVPLENLLLLLACMAVFETKLSATVSKEYVLKNMHTLTIKDAKDLRFEMNVCMFCNMHDIVR